MEKEIKEFEQKIAEGLTGNLTKKIEEAVALVVDEKLKKLGVDKIDAKYGFVPGIISKEDLEKMTKEERVAEIVKALLRNDVVTAKALSEGTDSAGGYLVPDEFSAEVLRLAGEYGIIRKYARIIPMGRKTKKVPSLAGGVTAYWVDEANQITASQPSFGLVTLTAHKLAGISPITDELFEDAAVDVVRLLQELFAEAIAYKEDYDGFNGSGSPITGILNKSGVATVTMGSGDTTYDKVEFDDLSDLIAATCSAVQRSKNARFFLHPTLINVLRKKKDSNGQPIWQPAAGNQPATILGYPYEITDVLPGTGDANQTDKAFIVFGDLSKAVIFGDRKKLSIDIAKEATVGSDNLWEKDMQALRVIERVDIQVVPSLVGGDGQTKYLVAVLKTAAS